MCACADSATENQTLNDDLQEQQHDDRRQIESAERRKDPTHRSQYGFGDLHEPELSSRHWTRRRREPGQDDPNEDHDLIQVDELTQDVHADQYSG